MQRCWKSDIAIPVQMKDLKQMAQDTWLKNSAGNGLKCKSSRAKLRGKPKSLKNSAGNGSKCKSSRAMLRGNPKSLKTMLGMGRNASHLVQS